MASLAVTVSTHAADPVGDRLDLRIGQILVTRHAGPGDAKFDNPGD